MTKEKTIPSTTRLPTKLHKKLEKLAKEKYRTMNSLMKEAVLALLKKEGK